MSKKYNKLKQLMKERNLRYWQVAAKAYMTERTFRYKMSETGSRFYDTEMFAIRDNVFPDKTLEELFKDDETASASDSVGA